LPTSTATEGRTWSRLRARTPGREGPSGRQNKARHCPAGYYAGGENRRARGGSARTDTRPHPQ
jgi:hypothetical protein